jgi:hypothetical protein
MQGQLANLIRKASSLIRVSSSGSAPSQAGANGFACDSPVGEGIRAKNENSQEQCSCLMPHPSDKHG